ncbi:hypothetical protein GQ43DRAFT_146858 [Delitschia confertaspora ATCC 74209]|uniref:Leucine Rich Repeat protein n=1 Tax=Delitschia confertaspora ATCC 74209 TaxID=1513339 RepID=A0A9P4JSW5_9PLEO|nr:hypothetical protein GQ43DRAFT_146858 [Delitschia confertaspora ATCC 74209]
MASSNHVPALPAEPPSSPPLVAINSPVLYDSRASQPDSEIDNLPARHPMEQRLPVSRAYHLDCDFGQSSSDPPLFSSEDSLDGADVSNYDSPRNKRKLPGPWWSPKDERNVSAPQGNELLPQKKAKFTRNYDSGVFMPSDDTVTASTDGKGVDATDGDASQVKDEDDVRTDDVEELTEDDDGDTDSYIATEDDLDVDVVYEWTEHAIDEEVELRYNAGHEGMSDIESTNTVLSGLTEFLATPCPPAVAQWRAVRAAERARQWEAAVGKNDYEKQFVKIVKQGVEENRQVYHLDNLGLCDEDLEHIGLLDVVIREPLDPGAENDVGTEYFRPFHARLTVNLNNNFLHVLSPQLFTVQFITHLSLRGNHIEELPPQIGNFKHLESLDLCNNQLKCLPYDVLRLLSPTGKLESLNLVGNPVLEKFPVNDFTTAHAKAQLVINAVHQPLHNIPAELLQASPKNTVLQWYLKYWEENQDCTKQTWYVGFTPPSYFSETGRLLPGSPAPATDNPDNFDVVVKNSLGTFGAPERWFEPPTGRSTVRSLFSTALKTALSHMTPGEIDEAIGEYGASPDLAASLTNARQHVSSGYRQLRKCHVCGNEYAVARAEWIEFWSCANPGDFTPYQSRVCSWECVPREYVRRPN